MEESLLKMDIFFFVATTVTVFAGVLAVIVLYYLARIMRDIKEITEMVRHEAKDIAQDFSDVRDDIKEGVSEVREKVEDGVTTVQTYTKVVAGTGLVKALTTLFDALTEEQKRSRTRSTRKRAKE